MDSSQINPLLRTQPKPAEVKSMKIAGTSCVIEKAIKHLSSAINTNPYVIKSTMKEPLCTPRRFLITFKKKTTRNSHLAAVLNSESSQAKIYDWDRSQGIRNCSNRTVMKAQQSGACIKAFLLGKKQPKSTSHEERSVLVEVIKIVIHSQ